MSELQALCEANGVKADFRFGKATSQHEDMPNNWRVTLKYKGRRMTLNFYGGMLVTDPSEADVISSLIIDTQAGEQSFEDFCSEFGYEEDSRRAEKTWKACAKTAPRVRQLLGDDFDIFANASH